MRKLSCSPAVLLLATHGLSLLACHQALAQPPAPQLVTSGTAEVSVPAYRASFSIGVTTSAPTAATAGADNARISKSVLAALERAGLERGEIFGSRLYVRPKWEYDDKGQHPRRTAFEASNTLEIETNQLAQIGNFIDAGLSAGATDASEVTYSAKDIDEARRRALSQAVAAAKGDAEAMARAGGGSLGELLLLSTERSNDGGGLQQLSAGAMRRMPGPVATEVIPGEIKVSAQIIARWQFVAKLSTK